MVGLGLFGLSRYYYPLGLCYCQKVIDVNNKHTRFSASSSRSSSLHWPVPKSCLSWHLVEMRPGGCLRKSIRLVTVDESSNLRSLVNPVTIVGSIYICCQQHLFKCFLVAFRIPRPCFQLRKTIETIRSMACRNT